MSNTNPHSFYQQMLLSFENLPWDNFAVYTWTMLQEANEVNWSIGQWAKKGHTSNWRPYDFIWNFVNISENTSHFSLFLILFWDYNLIYILFFSICFLQTLPYTIPHSSSSSWTRLYIQIYRYINKCLWI